MGGGCVEVVPDVSLKDVKDLVTRGEGLCTAEDKIYSANGV